jgi:hypothetical protein
VSEYERDRAFALHVVEGALPVDARITLEPTEGGALMRFDAHGRPTGALRLAQPLLRRTLERQFTGHRATLKQVLENGE